MIKGILIPFRRFGLTTLLVCFVAALFLCPLVSAKAQEPYLILADEYPPWYRWQKGRLIGPYADIVRKTFERMGVPVRFEYTTWKRGHYELAEGGAAGLFAGVWTSKRAEYAFFTTEPLGREDKWVVTLKDYPAVLESLGDLKGRTVGVVHGYSYGPDFASMEGVRKVYVVTEDLLIKKLLSGRQDIALICRELLETEAVRLGGLDRLKFHFKFDDVPHYMMFSRKLPEASRLAREFSETLRAIHEERRSK